MPTKCSDHRLQQSLCREAQGAEQEPCWRGRWLVLSHAWMRETCLTATQCLGKREQVWRCSMQYSLVSCSRSEAKLACATRHHDLLAIPQPSHGVRQYLPRRTAASGQALQLLIQASSDQLSSAQLISTSLTGSHLLAREALQPVLV